MAQCAVDRDLVMLNLLCCCNQRDVANRKIRDIREDVRSLGSEAVGEPIRGRR
jgi:hypothetical protein